MAIGSSGESSRVVSESRQRPAFSTRSAAEDATRLDPSELPSNSPRRLRSSTTGTRNPYEPITAASKSSPRNSWAHGLFHKRFSWLSGSQDGPDVRNASPEEALLRETLVDVDQDQKKRPQRASTSVISHPDKLGTFSGVFVPTTLNVLSILMFLRFGFILGQGGVLGMMGWCLYPCVQRILLIE